MEQSEKLTMQQFICKTENNQSVFIDTETSNARLHILENPNLLDLVKEVLEQSEVSGEKAAIEKDLGREIGETTLVETSDTDEIIYAKRLHRDTFTRFVKNRQPAKTNYITVILNKADNGYELWSAWCGRLVPTSPGTDQEMSTTREFWAQHALVFDPKIIQADTITTTYPWN